MADAYATELTNARRQERELALCRFRDDSAVVYDARLLTYAPESVSIMTVCGRETILAVYRPGEALVDLFDRTRVRKEHRQERRTWAFGQLRAFVAYKAALVGLPVMRVDPKNTSRTCPVCQHCDKANRRSQSAFVCQACGDAAHADYNAACNRLLA